MQSLVSGMLDDINPITYLPFLKDMWSLLQGYDVERTDMSLVSDLADSMKGLVKAYTDEDGDVAKAWLDVGGDIANIFGVPIQNIRRDVNGAINLVKTIIKDVNDRDTTWGSMGDALGTAVKDTLPVAGWFSGDTKADKLYDAIVSGDTAYVNRLKGSYKSEDAYHSAVRKALRENDPRIKEAATAGHNGDPSERVRIARLIIADGFDQDDVVVAINAEINAMKPDDTSTSEKKEKGFYTAEDFAYEIANGDQAGANAVKTDIIRTAEKNGKTTEEAEKSFASSAKSELKDLFLAGKISEQEAVQALTTYCGSDEEGATADVQYWAFKQDYPDVYADDSWFDKYYEEIEDSGIEIDMYMSYRNEVKDITGDGKKEGRMAVINSLPITSAQKDALYLAEGWAASKLYEAPWH
jgi:nuclear transport factor 2 (NTF2) superfamily protein